MIIETINIQKEIIQNYKLLFEMLSNIILVIIATLTYINAKKTFFRPFKNEVFKKQIDEISALYEYFKNNEEYDLIRVFGLDETKTINIISMLDEYAIYKKWVLRKNLKNRLYDNCSGIRLSAEYANKRLKQPFEEGCGEQTNDYILSWDEYEHGALYISKITTQKIKELEKFINSPFLPQILKKKIVNLKKYIQNYESEIGKELTNISKEVPDKIKDVKDLNEGVYYINNLLNRKMEDPKLKEFSADILNSIEDYLKTNEIFN